MQTAADAEKHLTSQDSLITSKFAEGNLPLHILKFGSPLVVAMLMMAAFNLFDIFIVGHLKNVKAALVVVGLCDAFLTIWVVFATGIGNAALALIARAVGSEDLRSAQYATTQSLLIVLALSAFVFLLGFFASGSVLRLLGVPTNSPVYLLGVKYLRVALVGGFSALLVTHLTSVLRAIGDSVWPMIILVSTNVVNVILAVIFVLPIIPGFGGWGVIGAAWAAVLGRLFGLSLTAMPFLFGSAKKYLRFKKSFWKPDLRYIYKVLRIGLPSAGQLIVRVVALVALFAILESNYDAGASLAVPAAFAVCSKIDLLALFLALGWGQAAASLVGQLLGANKPERAEATGWWTSAIAVFTMLLLGSILYVHADKIVRFFFHPAENVDVSDVINQGTVYLRIMVFAYPALAVGIVLSQAFTGAGATKTPVALDSAVCWLVQLPLVALIANFAKNDVSLIWWALTATFWLLAFLYIVLFKIGRWKKFSLIEKKISALARQ